MICTQCSGNDFEKLPDGSCRCKYCGTVTPMVHPKGKGASGNPIENHSSRYLLGSGTIRHIKPLIIILSFFIILFFIGFFYFYAPAGTSYLHETGNGPEGMYEFGGNAIDKEAKPKGEFTQITLIPDSIGNVYVVGIYKNTGKMPIRKPRVTVFLLSKNGARIASGNGFGIRNALQPAEETPVKILIRDAPPFSSYEIQHEPKRPYNFNRKRPKLEFYDMKLTKGRYIGYEISGKCKNTSPGKVRYVRVAGLIKGRDDKIIGMGTGSLHGQFLEPGEDAPFRVRVTTVKGEPKRFYVDYSARFDR